MDSRTKKTNQAAIEGNTKGRFITAAKSPMKQWVKEDREPSIVHRCCATDLGICVIKGDSFSFSMAQEDTTSYILGIPSHKKVADMHNSSSVKT